MKRYRDKKIHPITIKELPSDQRPREKLQIQGAQALSDLELLTILIGSGSAKSSALKLASRVLELLDKNHSEENLLITEMRAIEGMGTAKATLISAALELGRRRLPAKRKQIIFPSDVYPLIRHYGNRMQEHFLAISLNGAHEVIAVHVVSIGLVNHTLVHPRDVLTS